MDIIVHVGAPKCGSSSVQALLSSRPLLSADDGSAHYEYVCITRHGELLRRHQIQHHARLTAYEVQVSAGAECPWATDASALARLAKQFQAILAEGRIPIISQESYFNQANLFDANDIFPRLGLRAKVVAFVRPQVSWLNSAWWQWAVWSNDDVPSWIEGTKPSLHWTGPLGAWRSVRGVVSVESRPIAGDVVAAFLGSIGISFEGEKRRNVSLDENLLNYLRTRPDLRSAAKPLVDFILEQRLAAGSKPMPWVLDHDRIADLIAYFRADNLALRSLFSPEDARAMEQEPMWWDPAAYSGRQPVPAGPVELTIEDLRDICGRAVDAVIDLDGRVRRLEVSERALKGALEAQPAHTAERVLALEAQLTRMVPAPLPLVPRLRKAISINGIRRLVGA